MNRIFLKLSGNLPEEQEKQLFQEGWELCPLNGFLKPGDLEEEFVVLTDERETAEIFLDQNVPVIYHEKEDALPVYGAALTILDTEAIEGELLDRVFRRHYGLPWMIAKTERLIIRESTAEDFPEIFRLCEEEAVTGFLEDFSGNDALEKEKFEAYIREQYSFYGYGLYTVLFKETREILGRIGFGNREYQGKVFPELGYLIKKEYRNQGYATEAAAALGERLEELTGEAQAMIFCRRENLPSRGAAEKICRVQPGKFRLILLDGEDENCP